MKYNATSLDLVQPCPQDSFGMLNPFSEAFWVHLFIAFLLAHLVGFSPFIFLHGIIPLAVTLLLSVFLVSEIDL